MTLEHQDLSVCWSVCSTSFWFVSMEPHKGSRRVATLAAKGSTDEEPCCLTFPVVLYMHTCIRGVLPRTSLAYPTLSVSFSCCVLASL